MHGSSFRPALTRSRRPAGAQDEARLLSQLYGRIEELYRLQAELGARLAALEGAVLARRPPDPPRPTAEQTGPPPP